MFELSCDVAELVFIAICAVFVFISSVISIRRSNKVLEELEEINRLILEASDDVQDKMLDDLSEINQIILGGENDGICELGSSSSSGSAGNNDSSDIGSSL